jgi:signal transduction histidine kinase
VYYFLQRQNKHLKEKEDLEKKFDEVLRESQIEIQEETMSALGKELHDNVAQLLSSTKMLLGLTQRSLKEVPDTLNTAEETLSQAIYEIRSLSKVLSKEWLEQFDLFKNLEQEVIRINSGKSTLIELKVNTEIYLASKEQIILFRIIQEALQNAIKHAQPSLIKVDLENYDDHLKVGICDDGTGFSKDYQGGLGQLNMKQRAQLLGGNITWHSENGKGCLVEIFIPNKITQTNDSNRNSG